MNGNNTDIYVYTYMYGNNTDMYINLCMVVFKAPAIHSYTASITQE